MPRREPTPGRAPIRKKSAPAVRVPKQPTPPERVPRVVPNATPSDHLAIITRAVMQAGLSWAFIDARWDDYVTAFERFDVATVAAYGDMEIYRPMNTAGIIHSKSKIEGTIKNARALLDVEREFGSIDAYHRRSPTTTPPAKTRANASRSWATSTCTTGASGRARPSPTSRSG